MRGSRDGRRSTRSRHRHTGSHPGVLTPSPPVDAQRRPGARAASGSERVRARAAPQKAHRRSESQPLARSAGSASVQSSRIPVPSGRQHQQVAGDATAPEAQRGGREIRSGGRITGGYAGHTTSTGRGLSAGSGISAQYDVPAVRRQASAQPARGHVREDGRVEIASLDSAVPGVLGGQRESSTALPEISDSVDRLGRTVGRTGSLRDSRGSAAAEGASVDPTRPVARTSTAGMNGDVHARRPSGRASAGSSGGDDEPFFRSRGNGHSASQIPRSAGVQRGIATSTTLHIPLGRTGSGREFGAVGGGRADEPRSGIPRRSGGGVAAALGASTGSLHGSGSVEVASGGAGGRALARRGSGRLTTSATGGRASALSSIGRIGGERALPPNPAEDSEDTDDDILLPGRQQSRGSALRSGEAGRRGADRTVTRRSGPPRGLKGLYNLGNTCFMNSCLQCISNTMLLTEYFLSGHHEAEINTSSPTRGKLAIAYGKLVHRIWDEGSRSDAERPSDVKRVVGQAASRFVGYDQQDAQEFLRFFLDSLHEDLNRIRGKVKYEEINEKPSDSDETVSKMWWDNYCARNDSAVKDIFCGQMRSILTCDKCGHTSRCYDSFWDWSVPIPKRAQVREKRFGSFGGLRGSGSSSSASCSLQDCLDTFTDVEVLDGPDAWHCSKCKKPRPSTKQMQLYRLPRVLVVHLKRFQYSTFRRDKLCTDVKFPVRGLDLRPYLHPSAAARISNTTYDLIGVSNHMGGMGGGHYTAHCLNADAGAWYNYNDSRVSPTSEDSIGGAAAYMLFYRLRE